ncbi:hypothetical protein Dimus_025269 [Dionaea muscipula]
MASSWLEFSESPLICGLPDDIALSCLARVPQKYHTVLKCVSKRWRDLVCSEDWWSYRHKHNLDESLIYALCRDKILDQVRCYVLAPNAARRSWKLLQSFPNCCLKRKGMAFQTLGNKLYVMGGCGWSVDATDEVHCYDATMNSWNEAAPLSIARCYFACEVLHGKIYAIGGLGSKLSDPCSWDSYDPQTNTWKSYSDPNMILDIEDSVVMDGKIFIRCGASSVTSHVYLVVYEPLSGTWQHADAVMASGWQGPAVVVDNTLYVLDQSLGTKLRMWQKSTGEWVDVGRLSPFLTRPPCRLVAIGKKIFVIGTGLSTVVVDVSTICDVGGVIVSSSIPCFTSNYDVLSCKSLSV